jgi:hypothetical protein
MRTKYVFTGRFHSNVLVFTPEELSYQLGSGKARLLVEPVPLWDRAVSSALDSLAAAGPSNQATESDPSRMSPSHCTPDESPQIWQSADNENSAYGGHRKTSR